MLLSEVELPGGTRLLSYSVSQFLCFPEQGMVHFRWIFGFLVVCLFSTNSLTNFSGTQQFAIQAFSDQDSSHFTTDVTDMAMRKSLAFDLERSLPYIA